MRIIEFANNNQKESWNTFIKNCGGSFLQSWEWGEVMRADGQKIWRIAVQEDGGRILAAALLVRRDLPFKKKYLYVPHGPVFSSSPADASLWQEILYKIKEIALEELFLKVEPSFASDNLDFLKILNGFGFKKSSGGVQPKKTLVLDLLKSHEDLLEEMHSKTRYNVRLAQKKGVKIRGWPGLSALEHFETFFNLSEETASRDKIRLFPKSHYRYVFEILGRSDPPAGGCELYTAEYQNEILASILVVFWGDTATYLYGASSDKFRNLMASYSIQWEAILDAKLKGLKYYDFWGIDDKKWPGVTRFKRGFACP
ncbi:MAG: peptidoglycan bridge formation glycyltransferase FemA/FemB family protein, partial [bacterium]|nr:peptidoglycan bridge formation glycyltransferase FemA/FemB family protein [bacterium]